jgi:calcium-dependent protein kinase
MAPEVLSSQVTPAADLWAAGVMAHQLLTGRLPFDDHRNPFAPSISAVWRSVLTDKVNFSMPWWNGISEEGKDFVFTLLNRWGPGGWHPAAGGVRWRQLCLHPLPVSCR